MTCALKMLYMHNVTKNITFQTYKYENKLTKKIYIWNEYSLEITVVCKFTKLDITNRDQEN